MPGFGFDVEIWYHIELPASAAEAGFGINIGFGTVARLPVLVSK